MSQESPTPLTDAAVNDSALEDKNHPHTDWVPAHFARWLERELAEAKRDVARLDWLERAQNKGCWKWCFESTTQENGVRSAIDAMQNDKQP